MVGSSVQQPVRRPLCRALRSGPTGRYYRLSQRESAARTVRSSRSADWQINKTLSRLDPAKILTPTADQWRLAGERAGAAVRGVAGGARSFKIAAERHEMLNDALTAVVASHAAVGIVTQDADFDLFMQIDPALNVLFYD